MSGEGTEKDIRRLKLRLGALFAATAAVIIGGVVSYHNHYRAAVINDAGALLSSIEEFKVDQITTWRTERLDDTLSLLDSPILSAYLNRFAGNPADQEAGGIIKGRLKSYLKHNRYRAAFLTRADGKILLSAETRTAELCPEAKATLRKVEKTGLPALGDFYLSPGEPGRHLDLAAHAVRSKNGKELFLVLRIDPEDYLYPLIRSWPTNSASGETLLIRAEGDKVLFLNKLRNKPGEPMTLELPNDQMLPATRAIKGEEGVFQGVDYRGKAVLAATTKIPGTDWGFVAKVDMDEVLADPASVYVLLLLLTALMLALAGGGTILLFRLQAAEYLETYKELDRQASRLKLNYELFTAQANDAIMVLEGKELRIKEANKKSHEIYGYTPEEFAGLCITDLVPDYDMEAQEKRLEHIRLHPGVILEAVHRHKDGSLFPVEISAVFIDQDGGKYLFAIIRDISGRKRMEQALRESESKYREIVESAADGILIGSPEGKITAANSQMQQLAGRPLNELLGREAGVLFDPDELNAAPLRFDLLKEGKTVSTERSLLRPDGTLLPVEMRSKMLPDGTYQSIYRDISERRRAEERLRESEAAVRNKLQALLSPEEETGDLDLGDIFDTVTLQALMDEFYKLTKIGIGIIDIKGKVLVGTGWQDICTKFHRVHPETARNCIESDTLLSEGVEQGTCKMYLCKNNLRDIATPITVGGRHIGNLFLGQFLFEDEKPDPALFLEQARRYGFDEKEYLAAYDRLPRFSRAQVDTVMRFYRQLADMLSSLSYGKIKLARALAQSKRAEDMLRESQEIFGQFMEHSPIYVFFKDENVRPLRLSRNFETMLGRPLAEILGRTMDELFPSDLAKSMVADDLRTLKEGKELDIIEELNGRTYRTIKFPISVEGKPRYLAGYTIDITDSKLAEKALRQSEEEYRTIFEESFDGLFTTSPAGKILDMNKKGVGMFGYASKEEVLKLDLAKDIYAKPPDRARIISMVNALGTAEYDVLVKKKSGEARLTHCALTAVKDANGVIISYRGIIRDITESRRAEEALEASKRQLSSIYENISSVLFYISAEQDGRFRFISANPAFMKVTGLTEDQIAGKYLEEVIPPAAQALVREKYREAVRTKKTVRWEEVSEYPTGKKFGEVLVTPVIDTAGNCSTLIGIVHDITERKLAEETLRRSELALTEAQRLAKIGNWEWDAAADTIRWSREYYRIYGLDPAQRPPGYEEHLKAYTPESAARLDAAVKKSMETGEPYQVDLELADKRAPCRWVTARSEVLRDAAGKITGLRGTAQDITERKAAEEALLRSEESYRSLFSNMINGLAYCRMIYEGGRPADFVYISVNKAFETLTGLKDASGKRVLELIPDIRETNPELLEIYGRVAGGGNPEIFETYVKALKLWFSVSVYSPMADHFVAIFEVINERKQAEALRALNAQRTEALLKLNQMAKATEKEITDFALEEAVRLTRSKIGYLAFLNEDESVLTMHSWSGSAMAECAISDKPRLYPVDSTGLWGEAVRQRRAIITNDYAADNPLKKGCPQGHVALTRHMNAPVFSGSRMVIVAGVANKYEDYDETDIQQLTLIMEGMWRLLERKKSEEALRQNELKYRNLFNNAGISMFRSRVDGSEILDLNESYLKLLGRTREETVGIPSINIWSDTRERAAMTEILKARGRVENLEFRLLRKNGEVRDCITSLTLYPEEGIVEGAIWDITERKHAELEIKKLNRALIDKNQEMENFLYITTHDLRSPLVNIQGFSQNLERYTKELRETLAPVALPPESKAGLEKLTGDRIPGALKFVLDSSQKMDALITALLKVSRIGRVEMKPETLDMNELLKKIMDSLRYQLEDSGGKIKCGNLPPCKADPGAVSQLFTNLLDNAIKYRHKDRTLLVSITAEARENMVVYTVADNGPGIPEKDLPRIWNVFYQPERAKARKGEGIGLPMVKRLIEKNGGNIRVESKEGAGAVFYVELPSAGEA